MLFFIWFDLVERNCADRCLLWEQLAQLVESNDLLILLEALEFFFFLFLDCFDVFILARSDLVNAVTDSFVEHAALEACTSRAKVLMLEWLLLRLDRIFNHVLSGTRFRLRSRSQ